ncbi:uncharacterized protein HKW66_Vig0144580 [Vigna angularis]|uniref:Uncharacterized protein n=4 Tax=Phaseolus angularis TaxID=3914 RepID=A0A8T0KCF9_PHAAN|nr:uncharacterized protein LOC108340256 isoform X3 [Vigna angularis]KAG2397306.1 uncharacterized protein HKW66_Vig0144580 [Vigna angularis]BAT90272.1 hypothetical protein VIGAN_06148500 [Vigna angularis var. angularis]
MHNLKFNTMGLSSIQILCVMFQRLMGHLVTRTRTLHQLARVTPFIHRHKSLLVAPISCSQTLSSLQFSTDTSAFTHHPVRLPDDLSKDLIVLSCESSAEGGVCHVYLVGVSHGTKESYRRVQATVKFLKPEALFLELCQSRASTLTCKNFKRHVPTVKEMVTQLRKKENIFSVLLGWFQAKIADDLHENEFRVAYEEAIKYGGKVILGDRPDNITLRRFWSKTPLWHKTKLLLLLLLGAVIIPGSDYLNNEPKLRDDSVMSKWFPTFVEIIGHERDQYMSSTLLKVASENSSVVAVVGRAHLEGIKKHWKQPVVMKDLMTVPSVEPAVSAIRILRSVGVVVAAVAIISGIEITVIRDDGVAGLVIISCKK